MLAIWTFTKGAISFIVKNWGWIATILMVMFIISSVKQCNRAKIAENATEEAKRIADNNLKAMQDSGIMLQVTREQLAMMDKNLSKIVHELDSAKKNPKIVYIVRPVYIPKEVTTTNKLVRDPKDSTRFGMKFLSKDSVRTIGATSWFNAVNTPTQLQITPSTTIIDNFALNFGLAIAQYDDKKAKMTRISVEPYYVDSCGTYIKPISKNLLAMQYRSAELLDVPYRNNPPPDNAPPKHKYSIRSGFSVSVNLVSVGYTPFTTPVAANWVMPSLGVGYSFVLVRNK